MIVRAVDGGGTGFRRADIEDSEVKNLVKTGPLDNIKELLDFVCAGLTSKIEGIVYAVAGDITGQNVVVTSPNIHFLDGKALGEKTYSVSNRPVVVCNDMEAAVSGMAILLPFLSYFMGITWSSGVGLRIFQDGKILTDSEAGHSILDPSPYAPRCGCGLRGCVESIIGGESIRRRVIAETEVLGISLPSDIAPATFLDIEFDACEEWAVNLYDLVSAAMAQFLASIQTTFHLPAVVWKGSFAENALPRIEVDIRSKIRKRLMNPDWEAEMEFFFSPQPENDSLIGAASILSKELNG